MKNIQLFHGDCINIMDKLISDGLKVDCIITDPPYGINLTPQRSTSKFKGTKIINDGNLDIVFFALEKMAKISKTIYMFTDWSKMGIIQPVFEKYYKFKNCLVWDKMWLGMGGNWRPNHELIMYGIQEGSGSLVANNKENILRHRRVAPQKLQHSCEKPISLLSEIISQYPKSYTFFDPFMGSGTTGVACKQLNRRFIGIELDDSYYEIARKRIYEVE